MKRIKKDILFLILIVLPFLVSAFFVLILPEQIPSNLLGLEEELESKYSVFETNILIALVEIIFYFVQIWKAKNKADKIVQEREKAVQINAVSHNRTLMLIMFVLLNLINFINLFLTYLMTKGSEMNLMDISAVMMSLILSISWIALGNVMPRMHENKDPFSSKWKNIKPQTQRKVNLLSGLGLMLSGIISFIITILIHNVYSIMITFGLTFLTAVILFIISYIVYEKEEKRINKLK
ncbi:MAG: hypothetical protein IKK33_17890 [Lachnospiraceae bacterium]|nr:hypothetical protein [Lachnospiraceae bacterium]